MLRRIKGNELRTRADMLSRRRINWAPAMGAAIAFSPNNKYVDMALASVLAYLHDTDRRDGNYGRESAELLGEEPPAESKALDHLADKRLFYWTVGGLAVRSVRRGHIKRAVVLTAVGVGCAVRDKLNVDMRTKAESEGIDTKARAFGKVKTALFALASTLEVSPAGSDTSPISGHLDGAMIGVGILSGLSHLDMARHIQQQRHQNGDATVALLESPLAPNVPLVEESPFSPPAVSPHSLN